MTSLKWYKIFSGIKEAQRSVGLNKTKLVLIGDIRICLLRNQKGFFAVSDRCPHRGESLSKGTINYLGEIICPWHNYTFNPVSGNEINNHCNDVFVYPLKVDADGFKIGIPISSSSSN